MSRPKEITKFACGFEAFHAFMHAYLWFPGATIAFLGIAATPAFSAAGVFINGAIVVALGVCAWARRGGQLRERHTTRA